MEYSNAIVRGLEPSWVSLILLPLSIITLLFSMVVAQFWLSGVDFGPVDRVVLRSALLCATVTVVNFFTCGLIFAALIWFLGLIWLFDLTPREARVLTQVNWPLMLLWRVLLGILASP